MLACSILAIFLIPTGFTYMADTGSDNSSSAAPCNETPGTFTLFPYARLKTNSNGSAAGVEMHLSNAKGNCSTIIYSSHEVGYSAASSNARNNNGSSIKLR